MEMMTPFPVPTHSRLQDTIRAVILTNEKPSLPVPATHTEHTLVSVRVQKIWSKEFSIDLKYRDAVAHVLYFRTEAIHYKYCMYVTIDSFYTAFIHKLQTESQRRDMDLRNVCIPNILLT